jgi:hypothetical protein
MSPDTCREYTVEHIDPTSYTLDEILWSPNSHKIVRLVYWEEWLEYIENTIHVFLGFSDRESTDGNPWGIK